MFNKVFLYLKNFDWLLFTAVLLLICFGLAEIYSIALSKDETQLTNFKKQLVFAVIGIMLIFIFSLVDYDLFKNYNLLIYLLGLALLVSVLILGTVIRGTRGWFTFGGLSFQPVEFIKLIAIIFLSQYFSRLAKKQFSFKHIIFSGLGLAVFIILVLLQPDLGSAMILFALWLGLLAVVGFKFKYFLVILLICSVVAAGGWFYFLKNYQKERLITYFNPRAKDMKQGYNVTQAIIAVGSGGLFGRGIGFGSQSQLKFLPEAQNDFIFAVIAEELGLVGVILILFFFSLLFYRLLSWIKKIDNDFGIFFLLGFAILIFIEMFINIGMNIGLLPVVGISLPFLSYGGSALVSSLIMLGITENIIIKSKIKY